jgi:hypothetical protein
VASKGQTLTTSEIVQAFYAFCDENGWKVESVGKIERELPDVMLELHRVVKVNNIERDNRSAKGYRGVELRENATNGMDGTGISGIRV